MSNNRFVFSLSLVLFFAPLAWATPTPRAALLVLNKGDLTLAIVDPATLQVVARVPSGEDPHEVIASADGETAYISNYGGFGQGFHTLSVVDLVAQKSLPPINLGALTAPHGLAQEQGYIYFTSEKSKVIARYDPVVHRIDWIMGIGQNRTHMILVTKSGQRIITSNVNSNSISFLEQYRPKPLTRRRDAVQASLPGDWTVTNIPVGHGPEGFDLSPDGSTLWAANSHDGTVSVIDVASKSVTATLNIPTRMANRLKFSPDGRLVLISDIGGTGVVIVDVKSRKEIKRLPLNGPAAGILMQPDGRRAYVSSGDGVSVIDLKTLEVTGRIDSGRKPDGLAWAVRK
ncbi:MAG TPA: cytochrome D1 domain-containing protein [Tepidisphaeraceae bacterium]|nr:cytochrome D1 domain-containing protein [Tepidisphaeraceae bacterium]